MAIAKKPLKPTSDTSTDRAAESFIEGRGKRGKPGTQAKPRKVLITHRLSPELLARIDAAARRRGISRAAWINFYLSQCAEEEAS
jgi:hypothetical protein